MGMTPPPMPKLSRPVSFTPTGWFGMSQECRKQQIANAARRNFGYLSDKEFLSFWFDEDSSTLDEDEIGIWDSVWRFEYNRRFLLRPAEPQPNTQGKSVLLRPLDEKYVPDFGVHVKC